MKFIVICFALFFSCWAFADHEVPLHECDAGSCTPEMLKDWNTFNQGTALLPAMVGGVFSGPCYHRSGEYDPKDQHWGVIYITPGADGFGHMNGKFGFFYPTNPYANLTPADADREFTPVDDANSQMHPASDYAWVDFNPGKTPIIQYFLRARGPDTIEALGFWSVNHTLFCEFSRNH